MLSANYETAVGSVSQWTECLCVQISSKLIRVRTGKERTEHRREEEKRDLIF